MSRQNAAAAFPKALRDDLLALRERVAAQEVELARLRQELERLRAQAGRPPADRAALEAEVAALQAELARCKRGRPNASNSSKPPSSDHPHDPLSQRKDPAAKRDPDAPKRKRGGQPGHPGAHRPLVPVAEVDHLVPCIPSVCSRCQAALPSHPNAAGPPPIREQCWELPPSDWIITEYQRHAGDCGDCGARTWGERPADAPRGCLGFRAQATVGLLTGGAQLSRRGARTLLGELNGLPLSLGGLSTVEEALCRALAAADAEIAGVVRVAGVVNCDESPWRAAAGKPWLWTAATPTATLFRITPRRDTAGYERLGLDQPGQVKVTDRFTVYTSQFDPAEHAVCWSHLARDFAGWVEHESVAGGIARWLAERTHQLFHHWHAFQAGACDRAGLAVRLAPVQAAIQAALRWGGESGVPKFQGLCRNLLARWETLWTFVTHEGVEPTNNLAERALRPGVLWRKTSLFTQSERGRTYVERMLTVKTTLRKIGGNLLEFLTESLRCTQAGLPPPRVFAAASN